MLKIKKLKPMYNGLLTTARVYAADEAVNGIIDSSRQKGALKEYQTVLAVGDSVRGIKVGDLVCVNPAAYAVHKYEDKSLKNNVITANPVTKYMFNTIEVDGINCLRLYDRDIDFVVEEYEEDEPQQIETSKIVL